MTPGRLDRKVAMVTGGASGIGLGIARRLAEEGAQVVITDLQAELGESTAAESGFTFLEHDVSAESGWSDVVRQTEERFGTLDVLVNNAGIFGATGNPETTQLLDWNALFAVNVGGVFLGCRAAIPAMRRAGAGSIVNISSIGALQATSLNAAYGASKAAVRHFTRSVAQYCAEEKLSIRCNSVHPGVVYTPIWDRIAPDRAAARGISVDQVLAEATARVPLGGWTRVEDIAAAVAFLASDDARHITGEKLIVDGGIVNCDTAGYMRLSIAQLS